MSSLPTLSDDLVILRPGGAGWEFVAESVADPGRRVGSVKLADHGRGRCELSAATHDWLLDGRLVERACRLVLAWGFDTLGIQTVLHVARRGDWSVRRLAWSLGFTLDGTVRDWLPGDSGLDSVLDDAWIGSLLRGEEMAPRSDWIEVPRIVGRSVVLRPHRDEDLLRVLEACNDERTSYWLGHFPQPYTPDHAHRFLAERGEAMADGSALHWMCADPVDDQCLGAVSLMFRGPGLDAEVGYWSHPLARGRGVMTEAVSMAVRHAFIPFEDGGMGLPRVTGYAAVDNLASRRVLEVNGFRLTGIERRAAVVRDGRHDLAGYDLLVEDLLVTG